MGELPPLHQQRRRPLAGLPRPAPEAAGARLSVPSIAGNPGVPAGGNPNPPPSVGEPGRQLPPAGLVPHKLTVRQPAHSRQQHLHTPVPDLQEPGLQPPLVVPAQTAYLLGVPAHPPRSDHR